jgi:hypothetical protein
LKTFEEGYWQKRKNSGGNKPNPGYNICIYGKITTKPVYNYHVLIKMFERMNKG